MWTQMELGKPPGQEQRPRGLAWGEGGAGVRGGKGVWTACFGYQPLKRQVT